jgi:hypothetical protein
MKIDCKLYNASRWEGELVAHVHSKSGNCYVLNYYPDLLLGRAFTYQIWNTNGKTTKKARIFYSDSAIVALVRMKKLEES